MELSRREFLRYAGGLGLGLSLAPRGPQPGPPPISTVEMLSGPMTS